MNKVKNKMNNNFYNKYDAHEQAINQMLDQLAQRMLDGTTTEEDVLTIMKHSEILKHKVNSQQEWNQLRATTREKIQASANSKQRPQPK